MASVYALTKEEGGRHTAFFTNYRPQFFFRTADVTGSIALPESRQMVLPGDNAEVECTLISPMAIQVRTCTKLFFSPPLKSPSRRVHGQEGMRFAFREGGKTVGAGVVSKILE